MGPLLKHVFSVLPPAPSLLPTTVLTALVAKTACRCAGVLFSCGAMAIVSAGPYGLGHPPNRADGAMRDRRRARSPMNRGHTCGMISRKRAFWPRVMGLKDPRNCAADEEALNKVWQGTRCRSFLGRLADTGRARGSERGMRLAGFISLAGIFAVNAMGFVDHDTQSGLGCGANWPLCHGALIPAFSNEAVIIEYVHRLLTLGFVAVLIVFLLGAWRRHRVEHWWKSMTVVLTSLLLVETVICTAGVLTLMPNVVMAGLAPIGLAAQAVLWIMVFYGDRFPRRRDKGSEARRSPEKFLTWMAGVAFFLYLYGSAWLSYSSPSAAGREVVDVAGILVGLAGVIAMIYDLRSRVPFRYMMWPLLAAPFVGGFTGSTVFGDLLVYVWLSWCVELVALRIVAGHREVAQAGAVVQPRNASSI